MNAIELSRDQLKTLRKGQIMNNITSVSYFNGEGSGIIRRVDELHRIVLTKDVAVRHLQTGENTPLEIIPAFDDSGRPVVILRRYMDVAHDSIIHIIQQQLSQLLSQRFGSCLCMVFDECGFPVGSVPTGIDRTAVCNTVQLMKDAILSCKEVACEDPEMEFVLFGIRSEKKFHGAFGCYGKKEDVEDMLPTYQAMAGVAAALL